MVVVAVVAVVGIAAAVVAVVGIATAVVAGIATAVVAGIATAVVAGIATAVVAVAPIRDRHVAARAARQQSRRNRNRTLYCHLILSRNFYSS